MGGVSFPLGVKLLISPRGKMVVWDTIFNCSAAIFFQFCELSLNPFSAVIVSPDGMGSCDISKLLMKPIGVRAWIFSF